MQVTLPADAVAKFALALTASVGTMAAYPVRANDEISGDELIAYDRNVTDLDRRDYLAYLRKLSGARTCMAFAADGGRIACGAALAQGDTLMHLYAESDSSAVALVVDMCKHWPHQRPMTFCAPRESLLYRVGHS